LCALNLQGDLKYGKVLPSSIPLSSKTIKINTKNIFVAAQSEKKRDLTFVCPRNLQLAMFKRIRESNYSVWYVTDGNGGAARVLSFIQGNISKLFHFNKMMFCV